MPEVNLKFAILKTLAFFDIFSFPLTALEVWQNLFGLGGASLGEVEAELNKISQIKSAQGFYFLSSNSEKIVKTRHERYGLAEQKFKKVKKVVRWLALLPGVRLIGVCNTLAYSNAREESDIDLFIIAEKGKVWTARFYCLLFLKIFGLRPKAGKTKDRFCLSFFVDADNLDLTTQALPRDDIYLWYWINQLCPVYDAGGYYQKFKAANSWTKKYLPQSLDIEPSPRRTVRLGFLGRGIKKIKEAFIFLKFWESFFRSWQMRILPEKLKTKINKDPGIVIKDGVIKLIINDRREGYRNEWVIKVNQLSAGEK